MSKDYRKGRRIEILEHEWFDEVDVSLLSYFLFKIYFYLV